MRSLQYNQLNLNLAWFPKLVVYLFLCVIIGACDSGGNQFERLQTKGEIKIALTPDVKSPDLATNLPSFEEKLAQLIADNFGLKASFIQTNQLSNSITAVMGDEVDIVAGLTITHMHEALVHFSYPYQSVEDFVVYHRGYSPINSPAKLTKASIQIPAESHHIEQLQQLQGVYPELNWDTSQNQTIETLLARVNEGQIDATLINSQQLALLHHHFPEVNIGFDIYNNSKLAFASKRTKRYPRLYNTLIWLNQQGVGIAAILAQYIPDDYSLIDAINEQLLEFDNNGQTNQLIDEYYNHLQPFDYVDVRTYLIRVQSILPKYRPLFQDAAGDDLDWRLLAAMSYQESHWDPLARSPTGVRGMMQLTLPTAKQLGVTNRLDAQESIMGGSKYVRHLKERLPDDIDEHERTWFALAAYNIGWGHLMDVRQLTQEQGGDPNQWASVKARLPLLQDPDWYRQTQYGFARGNETVSFVDNIRRYYDVLLKITDATET